VLEEGEIAAARTNQVHEPDHESRRRGRQGIRKSMKSRQAIRNKLVSGIGLPMDPGEKSIVQHLKPHLSEASFLGRFGRDRCR